ncbi:MAG: hypothetical protein KGR26_16820, partial [Cyanobacteria bacterium REEB65]|nr:hypothetical protein [Cyanobacteria bacterium REEB65]
MDQGAAWDGDAAVDRLRKWAGVDADEPKAEAWQKYEKGFAWVDSSAKDNLGSYKLPHHDVKDGELVVNFKGVAAAMAALNGARGSGMDLSDADKSAVHAHLASHYKQFDQPVPELKAAKCG